MLSEAAEIAAQTAPPEDLVTFLWIAVGVLGTTVGVLFRQLIVSMNRNTELLERQFKQSETTAKAIRDAVLAIEALERTMDLDNSLRELLQQAEERTRDR